MLIFKKTIQILSAGLAAVLILTLFCCFYSNQSTHIPNPNHNTDYTWRPGFRWMLCTEGISYGKIDSQGYNNPNVIENPDILLLGSSHMEALNVMQDESTASVLQKKLGNSLSVYNKGISGHHFVKVCQYLEDNLKLYETPPKYTIIETSSLKIDRDDLEQILNHTVEFTPSYTESAAAKLQQNPFFRSCYHALTNGWLDLLVPGKKKANTLEKEVFTDINDNVYNNLFAYIDQIQKKYHTQIIIFFHPTATILENGNVVFTEPYEESVFSESCRKHDIIFLNMEDAFYRMYHSSYKLPHGFTTGEIGSGHLNADGHQAIADELYRIITKLEEVNGQCN